MAQEKMCFKAVGYSLSYLLDCIEIGDIGLPDIQRPFVWTNTRVRNLFDSMFRGFPVGHLLFWENGRGGGHRHIGVDAKAHPVPARLIVDGQQRLTSLYAVFRGKKVIDEDYQEREIEIAFHPSDGEFKVADAPIRRDPEWIANLSNVWSRHSSSYELIEEFLARKRAVSLTADDQAAAKRNLDRLYDLLSYPFTALEIAASVDEEEVAKIFERSNSQAVQLNQADFILTLMSVFWDQGRKDLEEFCRTSREPAKAGAPPSPYNHLIDPYPDQLLRVDVALGFERGKLRSIYNILRGKDIETGEFNEDLRVAQFRVLAEAQSRVLNLNHWHKFLSCLTGAGFRSAELISSQNALLYSYAMYLIGATRFDMDEHRLQSLIGRWFFAATLTSRYTGSFETVAEEELNRLKEVSDAGGFVRTLETIISNTLTEDYWNITLPGALDSSSSRNPQYLCYLAAQIILDAPVLFSATKKIGTLFDPSVRPTKKPLETHHLFPRAWLGNKGVRDLKTVNQVANFALAEWWAHLETSDDPPSEYVPEARERFANKVHEWEQMNHLHALPDGWETMDYLEFLRQRRVLMAKMIRRGFERL